MLRFVLIAFAIVAAAWLLLRLARELRQEDGDWRGIAFAGGFVALAFYLQHSTGISGL